MRAFDMALAALALRASPVSPPQHERQLVPAVDDAGAATLDRNRLDLQHAALVASLWPETRPCVVPASFPQLAAPALFGVLFKVGWQPARRGEAMRPPPGAGRAYLAAA